MPGPCSAARSLPLASSQRWTSLPRSTRALRVAPLGERASRPAGTVLAAEAPPDLAGGDVPQPDRLRVPPLTLEPHAEGRAGAGGHQGLAVRRELEPDDAGAVALELADFLAGGRLVQTGDPLPA